MAEILRVAGVADNQVAVHERLAEHDRVMSFIAEEGNRLGVGAWVHAGDVFDNPDGSTCRERDSVAAFFDRIAEDAEIVVVGGNHEAPGEVEELRRLRRKGQILAYEDPAVAALLPPTVDRGTRWPLVVQAMPWPRKAALLRHLEATSKSFDPATFAGSARAALQATLAGLGQMARDAAASVIGRRVPVVLGAHVSLIGARSDSDQPLIGTDIEVALEDLALAAPDFGILGHIHMAQEWLFNEVPYAYCASPRRTSYASGELKPKGFLIVEFEDGIRRRWWRVETPATPMILWETSFDAGAFAPAAPDVPKGAEVRFRYSYDSEAREVAAARAEEERTRLLDLGAAEVVLQPRMRPKLKARQPEIAAAADPAEKLRLFLDGRVPVERIPALVERFARILD